MTLVPAAQHMSSHVLKQLDRHRSRFSEGGKAPPLFVAVQGPQGSGKTFLTTHLRDELKSEHGLNVAVLSIDDLYLPHAGLVALAEAHPENSLLKGRGQPGTHDVKLGVEVLNALKHINEANGRVVKLPGFDKSLFGGQGDRVEGVTIKGPVDIVLFEGWCVGFYPTSQEEIDRRWLLPVQGLGENFFQSRGFRKEDVVDVNERLNAYLEWWAFFDVFVQIKPVDSHPYDYIYTWRLEQEHYMKAQNGGKGMTDDQVEQFVDRYIPGYVFFGDGVTQGAGSSCPPPWIGNGLMIQIGKEREVLEVGTF